RQRYQVGGARREAQEGFPHVIAVGLPALIAARERGIAEDAARVDALLSIMASLDDTCLLHRAGLAGLHAGQHGARRVLQAGGSSTRAGRDALAAHVVVRTSVDGYSHIWKSVLDRFFTRYDGAAQIEINDFGATPGVVALRLAEAVEAAEQGDDA